VRLNLTDLGEVKRGLILQAQERRLTREQRLSLNSVDRVVGADHHGQLIEADDIPARSMNDEQRRG